jgi:PhnB protein
MATTSTYLNFTNNTEDAFNFYRSVFGGEFIDKIHRFGDIPTSEWMPPISESDKNLVMHIGLPILGGHILMWTDAPESMGFKLIKWNNVNISLHPDSKEEADKLFNKLSANWIIEMPMADMFWWAYYGAFTDQFWIKWMINYEKM